MVFQSLLTNLPNLISNLKPSRSFSREAICFPPLLPNKSSTELSFVEQILAQFGKKFLANLAAAAAKFCKLVSRSGCRSLMDPFVHIDTPTLKTSTAHTCAAPIKDKRGNPRNSYEPSSFGNPDSTSLQKLCIVFLREQLIA